MTTPDLPPEALLQVATYLSQDSYVACTRVCKSWNLVFEELVWCNVKLMDPSRMPPPDALLRHRDLIKDLSFKLPKFHLAPDYFTLQYPNLRSLMVDCEYDDSCLNAMVSNHTSLICFELATFLRMASLSLWKSLSGLENLSVLIIDERVEFGDDGFGQINARLESLQLENVFLWDPDPNTLRSMIFPFIRELRLRNIDKQYFDMVLDLMERCPGLEILEWGTIQLLCLERFSRLASSRTWPRLRELTLSTLGRFHVVDMNLAVVLQMMTHIDTISIKRGFGPLSMAALRPHFAMVRKLELSDGRVTSEMVQEILTSCPLLEVLSAPWLRSEDFLNGRPWVCTDLRRLEVDLVLRDIDRVRPLILERLSQLTHLNHLLLGMFPVDDDGNDVITPGLEDHFEMLAILCDREHFSVCAIVNFMEKEVEWMLRGWREWTHFEGHLNMDPKIDAALRQRLRDHGIVCD
ncbi:hypothetical protein EDD21DRAFT_392938 [Dissophora ornata]|nr:hypothetical protein EDD21DRAFT_392938 [Dissophora ornata]